MKKIKSLLLAAVVLSAIYAPTTLAANYTVIIANATTCRLEYSIGGGSRSSLAIGQAVARSVPLGQQVNLYMYATYQSQYPACGYQVSTATISYYYDATQKRVLKK
ncbi:MAG: hypothetical protein HWD59_03620 [Coxiellaceae bacterium]|nr:MAG: hypothetical protein HWD59_03620 [Coxiellaceae bacterium]